MNKKIFTIYKLFFCALSIFIFISIWISCNDSKNKSSVEHPHSYLNLNRSVKYVGDDACVSCHHDISESFHKSEMGKSFYVLTPENEIEDFTNKNIVYDSRKDFYYKVYKEGNNYFINEYRLEKGGTKSHELIKKIDYVVGSGNNTRSYMYSENGFFYEMPVSWFTEKAKWDLSPGFQKYNLRFSRPIVQECMNCHNSYSGFVEFSENKFKEPVTLGIGCERCHGPGELHVKKYTDKENIISESDKDTIDRTIVNPANLSSALQMDVCFQCHLQGDVRVFKDGVMQSDYRPGMKLTDVRSVFIQDNIGKGDFKVASHGARLAMSECYIKSNGKMTCITCHDPHKSVKDLSRNFVNNKCISCHEISKIKNVQLKSAHSEEGDCVSCHMRQGATKDVLHVNFTDHWIRKEIKILSKEENENLEDYKNAITLKDFVNEKDSLSKLNLGIAYVIYYDSKHPHPDYLQRAVPVLEEELKKFPVNKIGLYYLGLAYLRQNKLNDALRVYQKLTSISPNDATAFYQLGTIYEKLKNANNAIEAYKTSTNIFPDNYKAFNSLGNIYYSIGKTNEAIESYNKALSIYSDNPAVLNNLGDIHLYKLRNADEGKKYIEDALKLDPDFIIAMNNLGNAYMMVDNEIEAEKIFKKVIEKNPNEVLAYGNLAVLNERKGNKTEAIKLIKKVLEINPNDVRAKEMLRKLEN